MHIKIVRQKRMFNPCLPPFNRGDILVELKQRKAFVNYMNSWDFGTFAIDSGES